MMSTVSTVLCHVYSLHVTQVKSSVVYSVLCCISAVPDVPVPVVFCDVHMC